MTDYAAFLDRKSQLGTFSGFDPLWMPSFLFDFQQHLVDWALRKGKAAIFADCGLGKTPMQLVWAENIVRKTGGRVLILTPLAVGAQTVREAEKFGIEVARSRDGTLPGARIVVSNYEQLHHFTANDFAGVVCDESSILKSFDGTTRAAVTEFMRRVPYRLLCTATAAPNDYVELGTSSEALGELGHMDMLNRFFRNQNNTSDTKGRWRGHGAPRVWEGKQWRFKGHAEVPFWRWVCSWARAIRRPSDLGFQNGAFLLPALVEREHVVESRSLPDGMLFALPAMGLHDQRAERRRTIKERCDTVARLVSNTGRPAIAWCHLNAEGDLLESLIPNSIQVKGSDSERWKERVVEWFVGDLCICEDEMFSVKLAAWRSADRTPNTCVSTTAPISRNGDVVEPSATRSTRLGGDATPRTKRIGRNTRRASLSGRPRIQTSDSPNDSADMVSAQRITPPSFLGKGGGARSVGRPGPETDAACGSTSTTVTRAGVSAGCSVPIATWGSGSLPTTQTDSRGRRCICGHQSGQRVLVSKPSMFGYGLNLQACSHMTFFPSHSYEQYYQGVRRCWRFGQTRPVVVDHVLTEGDAQVMKSLQRKARAADEMFSRLVEQMHAAIAITRGADATIRPEVPPWLS